MSIASEVKAWPAFASLACIIGVCTAATVAVRLYLVEPEAVAQACAAAANASEWRCLLRGWAVAGFLNNVFGIVAVIAGVLATVARWRWLAIAALCFGVAGAVLYTYELAGVGLLLGALVWVRSPQRGQQGQQHGGGEY